MSGGLAGIQCNCDMPDMSASPVTDNVTLKAGLGFNQDATQSASPRAGSGAWPLGPGTQSAEVPPEQPDVWQRLKVVASMRPRTRDVGGSGGDGYGKKWLKVCSLGWRHTQSFLLAERLDNRTYICQNKMTFYIPR